MIQQNRILIADSDESFAVNASDMLKQEGCQCDRVRSLDDAMPVLREGRYDLAILEVQSEAYREMELIGSLLQHLQELQAIVITDSPTLNSAIQAIHLKLHAYLIKPITPSELLQHVKSGMTNRHLFSLSLDFKQRIASAMTDLDAIIKTVRSASPGHAPLSLDALLSYTLQNIAVSLIDVKQLVDIANHTASDKGICHLLVCPRFREFTAILQETVEVLEKTRTSFKSKEIADLRKKLGQAIVDINHPG